jgi:hypothetical protein
MNLAEYNKLSPRPVEHGVITYEFDRDGIGHAKLFKRCATKEDAWTEASRLNRLASSERFVIIKTGQKYRGGFRLPKSGAWCQIDPD